MPATVMLIGLGDLGAVILELLAREPAVGRIVVGTRNRQRGIARSNLARLGALAQGYSPQIDFVHTDIDAQSSVADAVNKEAPELILSTASRLTWWLPDRLPAEPAARIKRAGFGVWLPVHLALTLELMRTLHEIGYSGHVLTAPFPDVVNPILAKLGLAPTCGVGNLDEIVPKIRLLAAERLTVPVVEVTVTLVAHHALQPHVFGTAGDDVPPFFLRVEHGGRDVTADVGARELLLARHEIVSGPAIHFLTGGSTVRLVRALLEEDEARLHAPAPGGLPGGYPVLAGRAGVRPASIHGLSLEEAIAINERSHRYDGVERIEADGTAVFCEEDAGVLREELGYDCDRLPPEEAGERAHELITRFQEYARRYGVDLAES